MATCSRHPDPTSYDPECFRCKLVGTSFSFKYGQAAFHGPTLGERQRKMEAEAAAKGSDIRPVGSRWV
jgi:hypothetical protein